MQAEAWLTQSNGEAPLRFHVGCGDRVTTTTVGGAPRIDQSGVLLSIARRRRRS
jgi:hypothetical protein